MILTLLRLLAAMDASSKLSAKHLFTSLKERI